MTRLLEILISLAIVAVLFVAVGVMLPSSRHLGHQVETNRKLNIVFDTLNSFRRFDDWNPLVLRDPAMKISLTGPESGVGAKFNYTSQERGLGSGTWTITKSEPNKMVEYGIDNIERGENKRARFTLKPTGRNGRNVQITETYDVDYGWNILGRYSGLYVSSSVGEDVKLGLARLTNMLAAVPNYDYTEFAKGGDPSYAPHVAERTAENLLVVNAVVPRDNAKVQAQMNSNLEWIKKVVAANGLETVGPVRIITNEFGAENYSFDVAQVVRKAGTSDPSAKLEGIKLEGPVTLAYNEAGKVVVGGFKGHMSNLNQRRDALRAWALTHGYEAIDRPYESWKTGIASGFTTEGEYDIFWAVK